MEKKVKLDPSKVEYDGKSFKVVLSEEEIQKKFNELRRKIADDLGEEHSDDVDSNKDQAALPSNLSP